MSWIKQKHTKLASHFCDLEVCITNFEIFSLSVILHLDIATTAFKLKDFVAGLAIIFTFGPSLDKRLS